MAQPVQLLNLACNHCGASLQVKPGTQYVTCGYCGSQLMVHQEGGSLYTEVLSQIDARTENIQKDVQIIKLQNDLERLDREWQSQNLEEKIEESGKAKSGSNSSPIGAIVGAVVFIVFGILMLGMFSRTTSSMPHFGGGPGSGPESIFPCFIVLIMIGVAGTAIWGVISGLSKSSEKEDRETEYQRKRQEIVNQINQYK